MTKRRLTGKAALSAWPARLATVTAEPTDENLQRLCVLLDGIDYWVVQRWDKPGHDDRLATLSECRRRHPLWCRPGPGVLAHRPGHSVVW